MASSTIDVGTVLVVPYNAAVPDFFFFGFSFLCWINLGINPFISFTKDSNNFTLNGVTAQCIVGSPSKTVNFHYFSVFRVSNKSYMLKFGSHDLKATTQIWGSPITSSWGIPLNQSAN